jgi:hypothetical protein
MISRLSAIPLFALASALCAETIHFNGTDFKGGYVIVPDELPTDGRKTWVVADIHGAGGLRNESFGHRLKQIFEPEKVIFMVPSFTSGYQAGDGEWAKQLIGHFEFVRDKYQVHDKMFVHGHSGGGQFAHRFAMSNPKHVVGVSAHSSGSWACSGGYGEISAKARGIPFAISCGENDTQLSYAGAPHNRIEWFKLFRDEMLKKDFAVASTIWPGAGHGLSPNLYGPMLKECFLLATQGVMPASDLWHGESVDGIARKAQKEYGASSSGASAASGLSHSDRRMLEEANKRVAAGEAPDVAATMRFLARHPASAWASDAAYKPLRQHCKKTADSYLEGKKKSGKPLTGDALEEFGKVTQGLGMD